MSKKFGLVLLSVVERVVTVYVHNLQLKRLTSVLHIFSVIDISTTFSLIFPKNIVAYTGSLFKNTRSAN